LQQGAKLFLMRPSWVGRGGWAMVCGFGLSSHAILTGRLALQSIGDVLLDERLIGHVPLVSPFLQA
jgi:hypothetical protein